MNYFQSPLLAIVGGGQLGRMLIQAAVNFDITTHVLDPDAHAPCRYIAHRFLQGSLTDFETVYRFGKTADIITIEIENVNTEALFQLKAEGKKVYPQPQVIQLIQDKGLQKMFFKKHNIPTAPFRLIEKPDELYQHTDFLPFYMKTRKEGYDGRGVQFMASETDFHKAFQSPSVLEKAVDIKTEISVIVARNEQGAVTAYPPVGMMFNPTAHLVEFLYAPAELSDKIAAQAQEIAVSIIKLLSLVGILAVEMFIDKNDAIWINELAPRPHNSGHHTIEANYVSQYEQHLRAVLNLPLGDTRWRCPAVMVNLLGEPGHEGPARYVGLNEVMQIPGTFIHLYGKKITRPFRKMGHITILDSDLERAKEKAKFVKATLKVVS